MTVLHPTLKIRVTQYSVVEDLDITIHVVARKDFFEIFYSNSNFLEYFEENPGELIVAIRTWSYSLVELQQ